MLLKVSNYLQPVSIATKLTKSIKNKQITFEPIVKEAPRPPPSSVTRKKRKHIAIDIPDDDGDEEENRTDIVPVVKEEDVEEEEQQPLFRPDFEDEDEDEKPEGKPKLRVSYDGFSIFGKYVQTCSKEGMLH